MKISWNTALRGATLICLTTLMLTQFNNCGSYSAQNNDESSSSVVSCTSANCITPTLANLGIKVNMGGGAEYSVPAGLAEWNLGGDCNEGGYPYNMIVWELYLNGVKVRDSNYTGMILGNAGANVNSACVNGRFLIYLNLSAIPQDPVNRAGLNNGASRSQYDLYVEVYGRDTPTGVLNRNPNTARAHVSLIPIL
jgi:hypothetical protein